MSQPEHKAAHDLMPQEVAQKVPKFYETEGQDDPIAQVKLFTPDSSWTWLVVEYAPESRTCFGLVIGHERELGYFSLEELEQIRGPLGLKIERDLYFEPQPISQCQ